jgi:hypothetical protein
MYIDELRYLAQTSVYIILLSFNFVTSYSYDYKQNDVEYYQEDAYIYIYDDMDIVVYMSILMMMSIYSE